MAAMTTVLTPFSTNGNARTSTVSGHTASTPRLVIEKRTVAAGADASSKNSIAVIYATNDSDGVTLTSKVAFEVSVRYPIKGDYTDVEAALAVFRDVIAGDEFANTVSTQEWLT
jgi:hypothetical protein